MKAENRHLAWGWLAAVALYFIFATQSVMAGITGSAHDFKAATWNTGGQICIVCHAPHNNGSTGLLWNHTQSTATYTLYSSSTLNASSLNTTGPQTKLCLSCHDGTVAVDSFTGKAGTPAAGVISTLNNIGGGTVGGTTANLADDHPVGFAYNAALFGADPGLKDPASLPATIKLFGTTGQMECATCHDVHNGTGTIASKLLRVGNTASALCLTCHNK